MVGLGLSLAGLGQAVPQIMEMQKQQREQQAQPFALQALRNALMAQQQQPGGPGFAPYPSAGPAGAVPPPGAPPVPPQAIGKPNVQPLPQLGQDGVGPAGGPVTLTRGNGQPAGPQMPTQSSQQFSPQGGGQDTVAQQEKMMLAIIDSPGPPEAKFKALESLGAFLNPAQKMQQQLDLKAQQLQNQRDMLDVRMQNLRDLQLLRNSTTERGQDLRHGDAQDRMDIQRAQLDERERHNQTMENIDGLKLSNERQKNELRQKETDRHNKAMEGIGQQNADTRTSRTSAENIQGEEKIAQGDRKLDINQQNADTSSDRAGTYKYGTMRNADIRQQNADTSRQRANTGDRVANSRVSLDSAKIDALKKKVPAANKQPFQAATAEYNKAASLYQSLTRPGATPPASAEDIKAAKTAMDAAAQKMTALATGGKSGGAAGGDTPPVDALKEGVHTKFSNGQVWTLQDGKPVKVE